MEKLYEFVMSEGEARTFKKSPELYHLIFKHAVGKVDPGACDGEKGRYCSTNKFPKYYSIKEESVEYSKGYIALNVWVGCMQLHSK